MARVHIDLPASFLFQTELPIRVSDINYGGHVGNDTFLTLMQEARVSFYRSIGFKDEISFDGSIGQIIADAAVQYKAEVFLGDVLECNIGVMDLGKYGFDMVYLLRHKETGKEVARGKTGIVCYDYKSRKVCPIPPVFLSKLI